MLRNVKNLKEKLSLKKKQSLTVDYSNLSNAQEELINTSPLFPEESISSSIAIIYLPFADK